MCHRMIFEYMQCIQWRYGTNEWLCASSKQSKGYLCGGVCRHLLSDRTS